MKYICMCDSESMEMSNQIWRQYLLAVLGSLSCGLALGWSSPVLPKLQDLATSPLLERITPDQESWIGSLLLLGGAFGPAFSATASDNIGRKLAMIISSVPLLIGWLMIFFANNVLLIYVARLLIGFALGMQFAVVPIYLGEIADDKIRGAVASFQLLFINSGIFLSFAIGPYVTYWTLATIGVLFAVLYAMSFALLPETPAFYITKGKDVNAAKSLALIRGKSIDYVQQELVILKDIHIKNSQQKTKFSDLWATKENIKALSIVTFLAALSQFSGIDVMLFYMETLLEQIGTGLSPEIGTMLMGAVQIIAGCITPLVVDRLGRRPLVIGSTGGLGICLGILGVYAILDDKFAVVKSISLLPIFALVPYMILFNLGLGPVTWVLTSEMFPASSKSAVACICSAACWGAGFLCTRTFGNVARRFGIYTGFWILSFFCFIGFVFSVFALPETKGKSLEEIQDMINNKRSDERLQELDTIPVPSRVVPMYF